MDPINLIDSKTVDNMLASLSRSELLFLIENENNPLEVYNTQQGQRWSKDQIEAAIQDAKRRHMRHEARNQTIAEVGY